MTRPRLLDLCCCAGLAAKGYTDAGFEVVGFDIEPQRNYPYEFHQADVLTLDPDWIADNFDAVHASPPCQGYSVMSSCRPGLGHTYPRLIEPVRRLLNRTGLPWVIENVEAARSDMRDPVMLCGFMFGRELYRHCDDCGYTVNWTATDAALAPQIVVVCDDGSWAAHADDADHGERLRAIFDKACGHDHRVEVWTKLDADDALAADRAR